MDYFASTNSSSCVSSSVVANNNNDNNNNNNGIEKKNKVNKRNKGVKLSTDPQSVAARERRHRISDRFKMLQSLVPGGAKMDTVSMLEEAIHYVKFLKTQIWLHQSMINDHVDEDDDPAAAAAPPPPVFGQLPMTTSGYCLPNFDHYDQQGGLYEQNDIIGNNSVQPHQEAMPLPASCFHGQEIMYVVDDDEYMEY